MNMETELMQLEQLFLLFCFWKSSRFLEMVHITLLDYLFILGCHVAFLKTIYIYICLLI